MSNVSGQQPVKTLEEGEGTIKRSMITTVPMSTVTYLFFVVV